MAETALFRLRVVALTQPSDAPRRRLAAAGCAWRNASRPERSPCRFASSLPSGQASGALRATRRRRKKKRRRSGSDLAARGGPGSMISISRSILQVQRAHPWQVGRRTHCMLDPALRHVKGIRTRPCRLASVYTMSWAAWRYIGRALAACAQLVYASYLLPSGPCLGKTSLGLGGSIMRARRGRWAACARPLCKHLHRRCIDIIATPNDAVIFAQGDHVYNYRLPFAYIYIYIYRCKAKKRSL